MSVALKSLLLIQQYRFRLQVLLVMHAHQVHLLTRFPLPLLLLMHVHVKVMSSPTTVYRAVQIELFTDRVLYRGSYRVLEYSTETVGIY